MFKLNICSNPTCKHNAVSLIENGIILENQGYCIDHHPDKERIEQMMKEMKLNLQVNRRVQRLMNLIWGL